MFNIDIRLQCLKTCLNSNTLSQLILIVTALLSMTGRVTMLGISRWTGEGGSYRTVQRFFMVNLSHILINYVRPQNAEFSVLDLKAQFRGIKYVDEVLKLLAEKPDPILIQQIFKEITSIGKINAD
jgi:hypothetical protein